ncbi:FMN reductase [Jiangella rhizosphaerae]|uniref:NADPH-dependent FMN reductase n=1 Tax=Jiangella rhizosphaerae TaxID=2293569 RepID=A0A418KQ89_9ACTN|nr:FMN reductase [Jiangella rhizosphaerae]RIQ22244.1 NADPH-dependent FMN reductase [Jiangella rhizosphaerae]
MTTSRRIAVVSAGLRQPSSTRLLADRLADAAGRQFTARDVDVDLRVVELREHAHDLTNHLLSGFPSTSLERAIEAVTTADGLIAVSPIFTASYSGLFKTFFDVVDADALDGMPVLLGATGGTERHSLALEHAMRPLFTYLHAIVVPTAVYAATSDWGAEGAGDGAGATAPTGLTRRIERGAREFAELVTGREPRQAADPFAVPTPFEQLLAEN